MIWRHRHEKLHVKRRRLSVISLRCFHFCILTCINGIHNLIGGTAVVIAVYRLPFSNSLQNTGCVFKYAGWKAILFTFAETLHASKIKRTGERITKQDKNVVVCAMYSSKALRTSPKFGVSLRTREGQSRWRLQQ